jgi:hypothetical protein
VSDDPILAALGRLEVGQTKMRADVMERIDRLQDAVTAIRDDISVDMGAVDMARMVNDNTREDVKQMREQLSVMWKQLKKAEADIRELKGGP